MGSRKPVPGIQPTMPRRPTPPPDPQPMCPSSMTCVRLSARYRLGAYETEPLLCAESTCQLHLERLTRMHAEAVARRKAKPWEL